MRKLKLYGAIICATFALSCFWACEDLLEEETFTALGPNDFFNSAEDLEVVLNSVYGELLYGSILRDAVTLQEVNTDIAIERNGGIFTHNQPMEEFTWNSTHLYTGIAWDKRYRGIFNANTVIDNAGAVNMDDARKQQILAEARFIRAFNYYLLYDFFGPTPLITSSLTEVTDRPARASEDEFIAFIENELIAAADILPVRPPLEQYGRATKGAALATLTKLHMMTKNWDKAISVSKQVMDLGEYDLFTEGNRTELFSPDNQQDNEFIFVVVMSETPNDLVGNRWLSHVVPRGYQWQYPPRAIFAAEYKIRSEFLELFDTDDERLNAFLFEFVNADGETIVLGEDDVRSLKFPEYPNQSVTADPGDYPYLRFADILLSRAEALNEINGPNQESVDLLNMVREAAGVSKFIVGDFAGKASFRDFLLEERGREFHTEALRRQDLIRHGKFIEMARERGKSAQDFQVRFAIPQTELERNPNLTQNEGY